MEIKKVCSVNGDQPIRSNLHGLTALPAQHVTRMKTCSQQPIFRLNTIPASCPRR